MTEKLKSSSEKFACKYCEKEFSRERTLAVHLCEQKRRWTQQGEAGPRIGLSAYNRFYELTAGASSAKSYDTFARSNYYKAFVKFGWYVHNIRAVNLPGFIDYLLKNSIKLDWWTKDRYYEQFVIEHMYRECPQDALARTIEELTRWADETGKEFDRFFFDATSNKIASLIANGRISPWVLFNCDQGKAAIGSFDETQLAMVFKWIDPDRWMSKFEKYPVDVIWARGILDGAGFNE